MEFVGVWVTENCARRRKTGIDPEMLLYDTSNFDDFDAMLSLLLLLLLNRTLGEVTGHLHPCLHQRPSIKTVRQRAHERRPILFIARMQSTL